MAASRYSTGIIHTINQWKTKLARVQTMISLWISVQRKWMGLEKIFASPDIQRQIPTEAKMLNEVDKTFKKLMQHSSIYPNLLVVVLKESLPETLEQSLSSLETVQRGVDVYLDSKRDSFPFPDST